MCRGGGRRGGRGRRPYADKVRRALEGQEVLYYLVHSMLSTDFVDLDARGASIVADAAEQAGLSRIVYVGGIIADHQNLSDHLASRAEVGRLLHELGSPYCGTAGGGHHRSRVGELRDAAVPDGTTAVDGHAEMVAHPGSTHCDPRRAVLPDERGRLAGRREPPVRHRRARHIHLHRDDPQYAAIAGLQAESPSRCRC